MDFFRKTTAVLLSLLLTVLPVAPLLLVGGCQAEQLATPQERADLEALDVAVAESSARLAEIEATAKAQLQAFADALESLKDAQTAEQVSAIKAEIGAALEQFTAAATAWKAEAQAFEKAAGDRDEIVDGISTRQTGMLSGLVGAVSPAAAAGVALLGPLVARFAFPRSREHMVATVKNLAKGQAGDAIQSLAKALGAKHTSYSPTELLAAAETMARESGDDAMLDKIKALRAAA